MPYILLIAMTLVFHPFADDPIKPIQVVSPKDDGIVATGINGHGDLIYFEWT